MRDLIWRMLVKRKLLVFSVRVCRKLCNGLALLVKERVLDVAEVW